MFIPLIIAGAGVLIIRVTIFIVTSLSTDEENNNGDDENEENNNNSIPLRKGPWTTEEDEILAAYVTAHGTGNWNIVRRNTGLARCGKSCRLRWTNHLRPDLRRGPFSEQEKRKVAELHAMWGNKWAKMAQEMPGRTDNEIKNYWNTRIKKLRRSGLSIYPNDIKPAVPVLNIESPESSLDGYSKPDNDSQAAVPPSSNVPELVFNNYSRNHPLLEQPIPEIAGENTIVACNCVTAPTAIDHERGLISDFPLSSSPFIPESRLPTIMPLYHSINTSFNSNKQFQGEYKTGMYECPRVPSPIPGPPPFSSHDNDHSVIEQLPFETLFYEKASPRTNGDLEAILLPPKTLEGSSHCPVQGESSNSQNNQNLEMRDHANQDALGDFSCLDNYDKNLKALEDILFREL